MSKKKCRVLVDVVIDGISYRANQVINIEAVLAKPYLGESLDDAPEAVKYATGEGAEIIEHGAQEDRAKATTGGAKASSRASGSDE